MSKEFAPLLGKDADLDKIEYPVLASFKLDGIRGLTRDGGLVSRNMLDFPNKFTHNKFAQQGALQGLDGELILGDPFGEGVYRRTNSAIMSQDGNPYLTYYVFDILYDPTMPFFERYALLKARVQELNDMGYDYVKLVEHTMIHNSDELAEFEAKALDAGYEGIMIRKVDGIYKFGRSTPKEGILLKVKRFIDVEVKITGSFELMSNQNEAEQDELGRTKRSDKAEGKVAMDTLGGLNCELIEDLDIGFETEDGTPILKAGTKFKVGSGFTKKERDELWAIRDQLPGQLATIKFFPIGVKDKPRFPIYKGIRKDA